MNWPAPSTGHPRTLPPLSAAERAGRMDVDLRIGWLLRSHRFASPLGGLPGAQFIRLLEQHTTRSLGWDKSDLARYELGRRAITAPVVGAYEGVLGIARGHLQGVAATLSRFERARPLPTPAAAERVAGRDAQNQLDDVEDRVLDGVVRGSDWLDLSRLLTSRDGDRPYAILPRRLLTDWTYQLVSQLVRSTDGAYAARREAASLLVADPLTAPAMIDAAWSVAGERGTQGMHDSIGLLAGSPDAHVHRVLIEELGAHDGRRQDAVATALLRLISRGSLSATVQDELASQLRTTARRDNDLRGATELLARRLGPMDQDRLVDLSEHAADLPLTAAPGPDGPPLPPLVREFSAAARRASGIEYDELLNQLLLEALTDRHPERRHYAFLLLDASPHHAPLASLALRTALSTGSADARTRCCAALSYLNRSVDPDLLAHALHHPSPQLRRAALLAYAHSDGIPARVRIDHLMADPANLGRLSYATGMSGHPGLEDLSAHLPASTDAVRWWREHGSAVREQPSVVG